MIFSRLVLKLTLDFIKSEVSFPAVEKTSDYSHVFGSKLLILCLRTDSERSYYTVHFTEQFKGKFDKLKIPGEDCFEKPEAYFSF